MKFCELVPLPEECNIVHVNGKWIKKSDYVDPVEELKERIKKLEGKQ